MSNWRSSASLKFEQCFITSTPILTYLGKNPTDALKIYHHFLLNCSRTHMRWYFFSPFMFFERCHPTTCPPLLLNLSSIDPRTEVIQAPTSTKNTASSAEATSNTFFFVFFCLSVCARTAEKRLQPVACWKSSRGQMSGPGLQRCVAGIPALYFQASDELIHLRFSASQQRLIHRVWDRQWEREGEGERRERGMKRESERKRCGQQYTNFSFCYCCCYSDEEVKVWQQGPQPDRGPMKMTLKWKG